MARSRRWWVAAGGGVGLAVLVGLVALPAISSSSVDAVPMERSEVRDVQRFGRSADPSNPAVDPVSTAVAQGLPDIEALSPRAAHVWEVVHDRADWVGGATVTCDLGALAGTANRALLGPESGLRPTGAVDVVSRFGTSVQDGRITFAVTEPEGTTRALLARKRQRDGQRVDADTTPVAISWSGAVEGSTVGCTGVTALPETRLSVSVVDASGERVPPTQGMYPDSFPVITGCGVMVPVWQNPMVLDVVAEDCVLRIESRNPEFGLIVNRGASMPVAAAAGGELEVSIEAPPIPTLYQLPELGEVATAADVAAWAGKQRAADGLESAVQMLVDGAIDPAVYERILASAEEEPAER